MAIKEYFGNKVGIRGKKLDKTSLTNTKYQIKCILGSKK